MIIILISYFLIFSTKIIIIIISRDTPTAKIFITKSEHDFRYSMVVSRLAKGLAWCGVVILNLFFIYFSMLRGLQRGHDWQLMYLMACVIQFVVEVVFYETSECVMIHYIIPDLARNEIQSVKFVLHKAIESLWGYAPGSELILNAPDYLFISTQLANAFPSLLESMVVRSYYSYSPGELSKKWRINHFSLSSPLSMWSWSTGRARRFTVTAITTTILQYLGALSPTLQRVMIHSLQPLVMSGIYFIFDYLLNNPLYFIPLGCMVCYLTYLLIESKLRDRHEAEDNLNAIHPTMDVMNDNNKTQNKMSGDKEMGDNIDKNNKENTENEENNKLNKMENIKEDEEARENEEEKDNIYNRKDDYDFDVRDTKEITINYKSQIISSPTTLEQKEEERRRRRDQLYSDESNSLENDLSDFSSMMWDENEDESESEFDSRNNKERRNNKFYFDEIFDNNSLSSSIKSKSISSQDQNNKEVEESILSQSTTSIEKYFENQESSNEELSFKIGRNGEKNGKIRRESFISYLSSGESDSYELSDDNQKVENERFGRSDAVSFSSD